MSFLFKHKFFFLIIIAGILYWHFNPSHKFGIVKKWLIVYNRIPVAKFDFYVNTSGRIFFEDDLTLPSSQRYWFDNHFSKEPFGTKEIYLFIGTGFDSASLTLDKNLIADLRGKSVFIKQTAIPDAISQYNATIDSGFTSAILIRNN